jgi:hypothetical protein
MELIENNGIVILRTTFGVIPVCQLEDLNNT